MARRLNGRPEAEDGTSVPDAELELLALLERLGESEVTQLRTALAPQRPLAHSSIVTLLGRLERRGLVHRRPAPRGRAYRYAVSGGTGVASYLRRLAKRVFGDDRVRLVSTLFAGEPPGADELAELARLVKVLRERNRGGREGGK